MKQLVTLAFGVAVGALGVGGFLPAHADGARPSSSIVRPASALCTKVNPAKNARVTELARGANAFVARLEMDARAQIPEHRDATEEYIHVLAGQGTMWIDDVKHDVGPGTSVLMAPNAKVRFENGAQSMTAIQVFAGPAPAAKFDAWTGCP
jgi:quercetin dioxygenase-like cupin family protein